MEIPKEDLDAVLADLAEIDFMERVARGEEAKPLGWEEWGTVESVHEKPLSDEEIREQERDALMFRLARLEVEREEQRRLAIRREEARKIELEQGLPFGSLMSEEEQNAPVLVSEAMRAYMGAQQAANPHMNSRERNRHVSAFRFFLGLMGDIPLDQLDSRIGREFYDRMLKSAADTLKHHRASDRDDPCSTHPAEVFYSCKGDRVTADGAKDKANKLDQFISWAFSEYGYQKNFDTFGSVIAEKVKPTERSNEKRKALTCDQKEALLNHESLFKFKDHEANSQVFWMAAIMAYTGCRNGEALWLTKAGIVRDKETGIYYFDFIAETTLVDGADILLRTVKGDNSVRKVPIHSRLLNWGILDHWERAKKDPQRTYLFNTRPPGLSDSHGSNMTGRVRNVLKDMGIHENNKVVPYSLRHRFVNLLSKMGLTERDVAYFVGHIDQEDKGALVKTTGTYYLKSGSLAELQEIIERVP